MSSIFIDRDGMRLKGHTISGRNGKTSVRVEIEVTDPYALAGLMRDLQRIDAGQEEARRPAAKRPAKPLLITHRAGDEP